VTRPDIDLDYPDDRREEMIQYTMRKYGADRVAQIITFGTLGAKAAIRDVGRALDIPLGEVDRVARLVPGGPGVKLEGALGQVPELLQLYEGEDYIRNLIDTAREVEGVSRHASTHAAGVVITDKPLGEYTPLHRPTRGTDEGLLVTQYTMDVLEDTGLLKVDFLGLSTLTILRKAVDLIKARHDVAYTMDNIPLDDPETYRLLSGGNVTGIFQVESSGMRRVLTSMRPTRFDHIVAVLALYRPGPMEFIDDYIAGLLGKKKPEYVHPSLEPILGETFGICVFQEQIIRILTDIAGYTPGDADLVRKAVGKKIREQLVRHRQSFVDGARDHSGMDEDAANQIFDAFEYFARYGFNKAHAADYAIITVQTAYLKAHYPVEYMTALLTVEQGNVEKVGLLIAEARRLGIEVLPPDVNYSGLDFTIEDEPQDVQGPAIRYGMAAIKNVGEGPVLAILEARGSTPFEDIDDFCRRVDLRQVNRRALECLIKAGALKPFGTRAQLLAVMDRMMDESQKVHGMVQQATFFDMPAFAATGIQATMPQVPDVSRREVLMWEKELVGAYISDHPLSRVWTDLQNTVTVLTGQIDETMAEQKVTMAGMVNYVRKIMTKTNKQMAFAQIEDLQGTVELVIFPRVWQETAELWVPERIVVVRGRVSVRDREPSIIVESVTNEITTVHTPGETPEPEPGRGPVHLHVTIPRNDDMEQTIRRLGQVYDLLVSYPGQDHFSLYVDNGGRGRVQIRFPNDLTDHCLELEQRLRDLVGASAINIERKG
jgi:DNA polymerase-3 subunit alpha